MRAITIRQPWAALVAAGIKPIENRSRKLINPEHVRGELVAIHASREVDLAVFGVVERIAPELDAGTWLARSRITSAILGVGYLDRVIARAEALELAPEDRRWFDGPFGYVFRDMRPLVEPVPCKGFLGFWPVEGELLARVLSKLTA